MNAKDKKLQVFFFTFFPDYFNYFSCLIPLATTTLFVVRVNILGWFLILGEKIIILMLAVGFIKISFMR